MIVQTVVWTLLPDPASPPSAVGTTTLVLLASPRLGTDDPPGTPATETQLSGYPAMAGWPSLGLSIAVEIVGPDGTTTHVPAAFVDPPADAALWPQIFPPTQQVAPFVFTSLAGTPVSSYPAAMVTGSLAQQYVGMLPPATHAVHDAADDPWAPVDQLLATVGIGTAPEGVSPPVPAAWQAFNEFHRAPTTEGPNVRKLSNRIALTDDDSTGANPEFHTIVAALADHPALAKKLGLQRRISITLPPDLAGAITVRAIPTHSADINDYRPRTKCFAAGSTLTLSESDGTPSPPYLPLDDTDTFTAIDVDTDRSGLALVRWANQLNQAPRNQPPPALLPPALRSDGIFVAESGHNVLLQQALARAAALNEDLTAGGDGGSVELDADDIWHGYRVDVLDVQTQRWYPLCQRQVTYTVPSGPALPVVDDEGYVSSGMAHRGTDEQPAGVTHESLFRWNGWSLVAPSPGQMLDGNSDVADPTSAPDGSQPYHAAIVPAPGSLPALRYGRQYQLRARRVDLAGSSVPFTPDATTAVPSTPPLRYHRYDPVLAPVVVPRRPVTAGESAHVLVVRTDNSDPDAPATGPACERHLLAPKAAVATLETHGVLDVAGQHRPDPAVYSLLFDHDAAVVTGTPDPGADGRPYVDSDAIVLPWLPDPLSAGVTVTGLPAAPQISQTWTPGPSWFQPGSQRLLLVPGTGATAGAAVADSAAATITVTLPPGTVSAVNVSSLLIASGEELMGAWKWFAAGASPGAIAEMQTAAAAGALGQLSPGQPVQLVHAVRCPGPPTFNDLAASRDAASTSYELTDDALDTDSGTTHSVYAHVEWTDTVDDPTQPAPVSAQRSADLIPDDTAISGSPTTAFSVKHQIGDTRHHELTCTPVATSRFAGYFAERVAVPLHGLTPATVASEFAPGTVIVRDASNPATIFSLDRDVVVDYANGAVTRIAGGSVPDGATVSVEFVVPPITTSGFPQPVTLLATAAPAAPVPHTVVPAYVWKTQRSGSTIVSRRIGNYLRIYLQRPWFDSGDGELLAVLAGQDAVFTGDSALDLVSHFSADAVFGSGGPSGPLRQVDLPLTVASQLVSVPDPARPADASAPQLWAMGHQVEFDPVRRLWFCDVKLANPYPLVHLKLARLQPNALPGLELSATVDAGFHQPAPDRTLTVSISGSKASISVAGPTPWGRVTETFATVVSGPAPFGDPALWNAADLQSGTPLTGLASANIRTGTLALPNAPGGTPMRLVVQEFQVLPGQLATPDTPDGVTLGSPNAQRLCYFDMVAL